MATLDWSDCVLVEIIPGKVSGAPLLRNTRLPVEAFTGTGAPDQAPSTRHTSNARTSPCEWECGPSRG
jgi:hypothetical protein